MKDLLGLLRVGSVDAFRIGLLGAAMGVLGGCSFLFDAPKVQCETTQDCINLGPEFAGLVCGPEGTCTNDPGVCKSSQECIDANNGEPFVCTSEKKCVALTSSDP